MILADTDTIHQTEFGQWEEFCEEMAKNFELVTEDEAVRRQFCSLRQMGRVVPYAWKLRELQF